MNKLLWIIPVLGIMLFRVTFVEAQDPQTKTPQQLGGELAISWLDLVDKGDYPASWTEAASYFKSMVTESEWQQAIAGVRNPLGEVVTREITESQYTTSLPGVADGEYVVIQCKTNFVNKASSIETITVMLDTDGQWRVAGYFIK